MAASAQDTDTIAGKMLGEVVVEAKNATPVADGIEFRPSQREKKTSLDYFGLLEKMQIPVLKVNPSSREIKTNTGREVAYFINGREASAMEYDELSFNLDAPIRLFSRKLSITPGVGIARVFHSGIYHVDKWGISPSLSVSYIPTEKLSFSLYASTSQFTTIYAKGSGETSRHHTPFFHLSGSYTAGDLGCSLSIAPFYRYSKSSQTLNGPNINRSRTDWEVAGGRRIAVSLTYNIGYGRQVSRGNENIVNSLRSSSVR